MAHSGTQRAHPKPGMSATWASTTRRGVKSIHTRTSAPGSRSASAAKASRAGAGSSRPKRRGSMRRRASTEPSSLVSRSMRSASPMFSTMTATKSTASAGVRAVICTDPGRSWSTCVPGSSAPGGSLNVTRPWRVRDDPLMATGAAPPSAGTSSSVEPPVPTASAAARATPSTARSVSPSAMRMASWKRCTTASTTSSTEQAQMESCALFWMTSFQATSRNACGQRAGVEVERAQGLGDLLERALGPGRELLHVDAVGRHTHEHVGPGAGAQLTAPDRQAVARGRQRRTRPATTR